MMCNFFNCESTIRNALTVVSTSSCQSAPNRRKAFRRRWASLLYCASEVALPEKKCHCRPHPSIDAEIDLMMANDAFFLRARLNVSVPVLPSTLRENR
jgi:osmotically inducible protein OsmC